MGNLKAGQYFYSINPLDSLIHQKVFRLIGSDEMAAYRSYAFCSYACGIIFFIGLAYFIKDKTQLILSLGIVVCFAAMQFFFGYVENYVFAFAFILLFSISAINDYEKKRLSFLSIVLLVLATAFNLSSAVFVPSIIFLATRKYKPRMRYAVVIGSSLCGLIIGIIYLLASGNIAISEIFLPLWPTSTNPYSLFSGQHLFGILNLMMLNYPLIIIMLAIRGLRKKVMMPFYILLIGPSLLFTWLVDPKLGAYRDWDLLSISSGPILAFLVGSISIMDSKEHSKNYSIYIVLLCFGLLHTGSWIIQNADHDQSYVLVKDEVIRDIHYSRLYKLGSQNKAWGLLANRYADDHDELIRACYERYYGDPNDVFNTCQLAEALEVLGNNDKAVDMINSNWPRFKNEAYAASKFSTSLVAMGKFTEAENICQTFLSLGKQDTTVYYNLANAKRLEGQIDSFYYYLDKSYSINPNKPTTFLFDFYINCFTNGQDKLAESGFKRIMTQLPTGGRSYVAGISDILESGNTASIDSLRKGIILSTTKQSTK